MAHSRVLTTAAILAAATVYMAGCSSKSNPTSTGDTSALVGTYSLLSLTQGGTTLGPPAATGTLTLTSSNYTVHLVIMTGPTTVDTVNDAGTYTVSGTSWTQTSSQGQGQSIGSYTLNADTLAVNVTESGIQVNTVWLMQSTS